MRSILLVLCVIFLSGTYSIIAQEEGERADVPFAVIEKVPVYPGCSGETNVELKECMANNISTHVSKKFNMKMARKLGLKPGVKRIAVQFKIDSDGKVVDVRARGPHPDLETEAIRVVSTLPIMEPGVQRGEKVGVLYALPIVFKIEPSKRKRKKKS